MINEVRSLNGSCVHLEGGGYMLAFRATYHVRNAVVLYSVIFFLAFL